MRVIAAHTDNFATPALKALLLYAPDAEFVETKGLYGYNAAIASRWDGSDSLTVIEQDKEITPEVLPSFGSCEQPWCVYSYKVFPEPYAKRVILGLGCTRYSAEAQKIIQTEDFIRPDYDFWPRCKRCDGKGCWAYLDARIALALMTKGFEPHVHGEIKHYHEYPPADEWFKSLGNAFEFIPDSTQTEVTECPACGKPVIGDGNKWRCSGTECNFSVPYYR